MFQTLGSASQPTAERNEPAHHHHTGIGKWKIFQFAPVQASTQCRHTHSSLQQQQKEGDLAGQLSCTTTATAVLLFFLSHIVLGRLFILPASSLHSMYLARLAVWSSIAGPMLSAPAFGAHR